MLDAHDGPALSPKILHDELVASGSRVREQGIECSADDDAQHQARPRARVGSWTHRRPPDALEQLVRAHPALRRVATVVARQPLATEVFAA